MEVFDLWGILENHGASGTGRVRTRKRKQLGKFQRRRICENCEGHLWESDGRHTQEMRSPTGTYAKRSKRWVYVGKTQVTPPEFYGKARRSFKIGMITTVDPSDGEDMYVDSTDAESPPRVEGPPKEETKEEPEWKRKQNVGEV